MFIRSQNITCALHVVSPTNILTHTAAFKWVVNYFENYFNNRRGSVILINIIIGKLLFGWPAYISRLRMQSAGSNPGSTYTWSKNHVVSSKLCCDISRLLHEMPTSFIHNSIKYFAYLALYDKEQHSKLIYIVSSTHLLAV